MDNPAISARLRFLNESAHVLAATAPATSARLMSQFHEVAFDHHIEISDAQRRRACGGCGHIYVPGWTTATSIEREPIERATKPSADDDDDRRARGSTTRSNVADRAPEINVVTACWLCGRQLRQAIPSRHRTFTRTGQLKADTVTPRELPQSTRPIRESTEASSTIPSRGAIANVNSRKRAKTRKHQTLQQLLSRKQDGTPDTARASPLHLMDFLQLK